MDEQYVKRMEELIRQADAKIPGVAQERQKLLVQTDEQMWWLDNFDERQQRMIRNCRVYAGSDPAGLPGHQLMLIVSKMADLLDIE